MCTACTLYRPYERPLKFVDFVISHLAVYKVYSVYSVYRPYERPLRNDDFTISHLAVYNVYTVQCVQCVQALRETPKIRRFCDISSVCVQSAHFLLF